MLLTSKVLYWCKTLTKPMNSSQQLVNLIDTLQASGVEAKVTVLRSTVRDRKSLYGVKKSASRRRCGKAQMQHKIFHSSGHE